MNQSNCLKKGLLIVFEGIDGAGKSTVLKKITARLKRDFGEDRVFKTREPGGTTSVAAESIREFFLSQIDIFHPLTLAYLYAASRAEHVNNVILPRLDDKQIIISDRFIYSSYVYQGFSYNIDIDKIFKINEQALVNIEVDAIFYFKISAKTALKRREFRVHNHQSNSFDNKDEDFYNNLINQYQKAIKYKPYAKKVYIINAERPISLVINDIYYKIKKLILKNNENN